MQHDFIAQTAGIAGLDGGGAPVDHAAATVRCARPSPLLSVVPVINILTNMLFRETLSLKNLAFELIPAAIDI